MFNERKLHLLIDDRNKELWEFCNSNAKIEITIANVDECEVYSKGGKHSIKISSQQLNPASFTHELLHVYLSIKNVHVGGALYWALNEDKINRFFTTALREHVSNCLNHIKMLPLYLEMGYDIKSFITDYHVNKFTEDDAKRLKGDLKLFSGVYKAKEIDYYIGKFFAMKACPNHEYDYSTGYDFLKELAPGLFSVLEKCMKEWDDYDYTVDDPLSEGYREIAYNLVNGIKKWALFKFII